MCFLLYISLDFSKFIHIESKQTLGLKKKKNRQKNIYLSSTVETLVCESKTWVSFLREVDPACHTHTGHSSLWAIGRQFFTLCKQGFKWKASGLEGAYKQIQFCQIFLHLSLVCHEHMLEIFNGGEALIAAEEQQTINNARLFLDKSKWVFYSLTAHKIWDYAKLIIVLFDVSI